MSPHVQEEMTLVYAAGGRRYFTRRAAVRGAAKAIIRETFRATGDDLAEAHADEYHRWVAQLVGKIERGERLELVFDTSDAELGPGKTQTPTPSLGTQEEQDR